MARRNTTQISLNFEDTLREKLGAFAKGKSWEKEYHQANTSYGRSETVHIHWKWLSADDKKALYDFAREHARGVAAQISGFRNGEENPLQANIGSLKALQVILHSHFMTNTTRGWLFPTDSVDQPVLVTHADYWEGDADSPASVTLEGYYVALSSDLRSRQINTWLKHFSGAEIRGKNLTDLLNEEGITKETTELLAEYDVAEADYLEKVALVHTQFVGTVFAPAGERDWWYRRPKIEEKYAPPLFHLINEEDLVEKGTAAFREVGGEQRPVPRRHEIRVFNMDTHATGSVGPVRNLKPYEYKPELRDKIVLPDLHRDLIDVLTGAADVTLDDFVEGKSGGTTILCQGGPGLGKTLTAEIYSEVVKAPLYRVHSGQLGTEPAEVEKALRVVLQRGNRWGAVVLIDEADVYIRQRGDDLNHNAVVAAFLRTLEYFSGLLFMTTNRSGDVDDAIKSRCIAVISYEPLEGEDASRLWHLILDQFEVVTKDGTVEKLVAKFPKLPGRDMKELTKLVAKMTKGKGKFIADFDDFRKLAQFRGIHGVS